MYNKSNLSIMKTLKSIAVILSFSLIAFSCQESEVNPVTSDASIVSPSSPSNARVGRTMVMADCQVYNSVVTPAKFKPSSTPFDNLYAGSFKDGAGLISDAKPGDQDYNGGRWHMFTLKEGVDPAKYEEACSAEDLDLNDFMSTGNYFECPLLPTKGNN